MKEKLKNIDKKNVIYAVMIMALTINMSFAQDHVMYHLCLPVFIWSVYVIKDGMIRIETGDALLFFGMFFFMWRWGGWFLQGMIYAFMCTVIYQVGKYIAGRDSDVSPKRVMYTVMTFALAMFTRGILNYEHIYKWSEYWEENIWLWLDKDIYGHTIVRTQQAFYLVPMGCLLICFIYLIKKNVIIGIMGSILSGIAIWADKVNRGRMVICCVAVASLIVIMAYVIETKLYKNNWFRIMAVIILMGLVAFVTAFMNNTWGLKDRYARSIWQRNGGIFKNIRFILMGRTLSLMLEHPLKGAGDAPLYIDEETGQILHGAHNSWLDIGKQSGIIPFVLVIGFTIYIFVSLVKIWKNSKEINKYVLIVAFAGVTLYNMFEPAILNSISFWISEVFLGGLIIGLSCEFDRKREVVISIR